MTLSSITVRPISGGTLANATLSTGTDVGAILNGSVSSTDFVQLSTVANSVASTVTINWATAAIPVGSVINDFVVRFRHAWTVSSITTGPIYSTNSTDILGTLNYSPTYATNLASLSAVGVAGTSNLTVPTYDTYGSTLLTGLSSTTTIPLTLNFTTTVTTVFVPTETCTNNELYEAYLDILYAPPRTAMVTVRPASGGRIRINTSQRLDNRVIGAATVGDVLNGTGGSSAHVQMFLGNLFNGYQPDTRVVWAWQDAYIPLGSTIVSFTMRLRWALVSTFYPGFDYGSTNLLDDSGVNTGLPDANYYSPVPPVITSSLPAMGAMGTSNYTTAPYVNYIDWSTGSAVTSSVSNLPTSPTTQYPVDLNVSGLAETFITVNPLTNNELYEAYLDIVYVAPLPVAPEAPFAAAGDRIAVVSWGAPTGTSSGASISPSSGDTIIGYQVTVYLSAVPQAVIPTISTSLLVTGLTNGLSYTFEVAAVNSYGVGLNSGLSNAVTPLANHPSSTIITGLTSGVSYTFKVSAMNMLGDGPDSLASNSISTLISTRGFFFPIHPFPIVFS